MASELRTKSESVTESPMEHVVSHCSSCPPTRREHFKVCCKPTYQLRKLSNKGALIVLLRNYLVVSFFYYMYLTTIHPARIQKVYYITWGLTLPLVGWLADVCLGRHRMIRWSIWIMWIALILATLSSTVAQSVEAYQDVNNYTTVTLLILASIGFGGYQANVIQFGLDQLYDASTDEITSFISWYVWTFISGGITVAYANICLREEYLILTWLLVCVCLSIALIVTLSSENLLIKEPVTQNPFKLVYRIVKYAIRNKQPRCRSAFTYCEDELPSRIDFGKSKYGGPFTTEQVEDVKTFFRLLSVILLGCTLPSVVVIVNRLSSQLTEVSQVTDTTTCFLNNFYHPIASYIAVVLIPLYEFTLYPVLRRHFSWVKSHSKFLLGVLLQIARAITLVAFVIKARQSHLEHGSYNTTTKCIFQQKPGDLTFDNKWMVLPDILNSLSIATLTIGGTEFVCAQTPYSMRGLMFGAMYGGIAIFSLIGYGVTKPFTNGIMNWGGGIISCEFWYLLLNIIFLGIIGVLTSITGTWYKKRKREDVLPNEQIFAERYYTQ